MRIIGASWGRTGTTSAAAALEVLGFGPCGPPAVAALLDRVWDVHFGGWSQVFDRAWAVEQYEAHVAEVRGTCPPQRLVEWRVADGWPPLCRRLGVPVPDEPMPHLNRR